MNSLVNRLDKVASAVQSLGLMSLAADIDAVSNSMDRAFHRAAMEEPRNTVPFEQVDQGDLRYNTLFDYLNLLAGSTLGATVFGPSIPAEKLKRLLASKHSEVIAGDVSSVLNSTEAATFGKWLEELTRKYGETIPDQFFHSKSNQYGATFKDIGNILHVLDENLAPSKGLLNNSKKPGESLEDFSKKNLSETPRNHEWNFDRLRELDKAYDVKTAAVMLPPKFRRLESLLRALERR